MAGKKGKSGRTPTKVVATEVPRLEPLDMRLDSVEDVRVALQSIRSAVLDGSLPHTVGRMLTDNIGKAASTLKNAKEVRISKLQEMLERAEAVGTNARAYEVADRRHMKH